MYAKTFGSKDATIGFLWASLPSASAYSGKTFRVLDSWARGALATSDGTNWVLDRVIRLYAGAPNDAITGTTSRTAFREITIPGGIMGTFGSLISDALISMTNNANNKLPQTYIYQTAGGLAGGTVSSSIAGASLATIGQSVRIRNTAANAQVINTGGSIGSLGTSGTAAATAAVDTNQDWIFCYAATPANSGDTLNLLHYSIQIDQRF